MDNVYAYNELTGVSALVPRDHLDHPNLGEHLTEVRNGKQRGRMSEIVKDDEAPKTRKGRLTEPASDDLESKDN